jgi:rhodanese-related sulfurtransferase
MRYAILKVRKEDSMRDQRTFSEGVAWFCLALSLAFVTGACAAQAPTMSAARAPVISKEELQSMSGNPEVIVIDVRAGGDWSSSDSKIKGAVREDPGRVESWMDKYPKDKTLVFYWAWAGEGTSARVAQKFVEKGYPKVHVLKGGWNEWVKANLPVEPKWGKNRPYNPLLSLVQQGTRGEFGFKGFISYGDEVISLNLPFPYLRAIEKPIIR